jgi:hypothetical protein
MRRSDSAENRSGKTTWNTSVLTPVASRNVTRADNSVQKWAFLPLNDGGCPWQKIKTFPRRTLASESSLSTAEGGPVPPFKAHN